jgi:adenylate kinase family enzyme
VAVFGRGGKTSLARAIAARDGTPCIEADWIHHMPDWVERPTEESRSIIETRMDESPDGWVYDGNYPHLIDIPMARADSVIIIDLPFWLVFARYIRRSFRYSLTGQPIAGGNRETFRLSFASQDSHLLHTLRTRKNDYIKALCPLVRPGADLYLITSRQALNAFYRTHGLERGAV